MSRRSIGLICGLGYVALRLLHVSLFAPAARGNRDTVRRVAALAVATIPAAGPIILAKPYAGISACRRAGRP